MRRFMKTISLLIAIVEVVVLAMFCDTGFAIRLGVGIFIAQGLLEAAFSPDPNVNLLVVSHEKKEEK